VVRPGPRSQFLRRAVGTMIVETRAFLGKQNLEQRSRQKNMQTGTGSLLENNLDNLECLIYHRLVGLVWSNQLQHAFGILGMNTDSMMPNVRNFQRKAANAVFDASHPADFPP
jgi:hypothetical protein